MLIDFHCHSHCSSDGTASVYDMALAAAERGVDILCITDHADADDYKTGLPLLGDCFPEKQQLLREYLDAKARLGDRLDLRLGLELGEANHDPALAAQALEGLPLDFVIGSLHNLRDTPDFFCLPYDSEAGCRDLLRRYLEEHLELVQLPHFDVLGHIGYPRRYMKRKGHDLGLEGLEDMVEELFRRLIPQGRGIELNTSGLRDGTGCAFPELPWLKMYRRLGGEIVTLGSDSHKVEHVGARIAEGMEILREAGFKYYSVYKERKAEMLKL